MFEWMAWTTPVAVFFTCILFMLVGMTVWELKSPTALRRGFLPLDTTRGDRLFIGLLGGLRQPGVRRHQRQVGSVVGSGGRALHLDQFCRVSGSVGADHAKRLALGI